MRNILSKIVLLLGLFVYLAKLQGGVIAEETANADKIAEPKTNGTKLSGIVFTTGIFLSDLVDESYVERDEKIVKEAQGHFAASFGNLAHVPLLTSSKFKDFTAGLALSAGFGINGSNVVENLQVVVGPSILFNTKNSLLAFTCGRMIGPVKRLNGYTGTDFPNGNTVLTKSNRERGIFYAFTFSANVANLFDFFSLKKASTVDNATNSEKVSNKGESDTNGNGSVEGQGQSEEE